MPTLGSLRWPFHMAQRSLGDVIRRALADGPQLIHHDTGDVVVLPLHTYESLAGSAGTTLGEYLRVSPLADAENERRRLVDRPAAADVTEERGTYPFRRRARLSTRSGGSGSMERRRTSSHRHRYVMQLICTVGTGRHSLVRRVPNRSSPCAFAAQSHRSEARAARSELETLPISFFATRSGRRTVVR